MQRARGRGRLRFDKNLLCDLHQSGCLKLMLPRNHAHFPDAVMINTAGGLTGGDQLALDVELTRGSELRVATQTAERIYASTGDTARQSLTFKLSSDCSLDWLAQETILYNGGRIAREINVDMHRGASLLIVEPIVLGRLAMGEAVKTGMLKDRWRIERDGALCFADDMRLSDFQALAQSASLGGATALATLLFVDPNACSKISQLRDEAVHSEVETGISAWNDQLVMRCLSQDPRAMRHVLMRAIEILRGRDCPRVWTM